MSVKLHPESRPSKPFSKITRPLKTRWTDLDHKIVSRGTFKLTLWFRDGRVGFVSGSLEELCALADSIRRYTCRLRSYVIATEDGKEVRTFN